MPLRGGEKNRFIFKNSFSLKKHSFTLSEILITLVVIGIIAAFTVPVLINNHKRQVVETRLKYSYSLLNQVVKFAQSEYGEINSWNFEQTTEEFVKQYFMPYLTSELKDDGSNSIFSYFLLTFVNGIQWRITLHPYDEPRNEPANILIAVDINGQNKPNKFGRDKFIFYITGGGASFFNAAEGNTMRNVPGAGVYYDGYGYPKNTLLNDTYRGCKEKGGHSYTGAFCTALIANNGWKIPDNYPLKL